MDQRSLVFTSLVRAAFAAGVLLWEKSDELVGQSGYALFVELLRDEWIGRRKGRRSIGDVRLLICCLFVVRVGCLVCVHNFMSRLVAQESVGGGFWHHVRILSCLHVFILYPCL